MANPFVKSWKYFMSWFGAKVDEKADPKIQIQQAIEDAQKQHQALCQQAAQVIGNQRQLEMKLNKQMGEVDKLQGSARQALVLSDQAKKSGDADKAASYEQTAQAFATQLVSQEQSLTDLKNLHEQSLQASDQARKAVDSNAAMLKQKIGERTKLLSKLEQAKMQEKVSDSLQSMSELAAPRNVPSFAEVEEKIEQRYATALGRSELATTSVEGRMLEVEKSTLDFAGASRLDEIRASLELGSSSSDTPAVEGGKAAENGASDAAAEKLAELQASVDNKADPAQSAQPATEQPEQKQNAEPS